MRLHLASVVILAAAAAALTAPAPTSAATRTDFDRDSGVRLTLEGRVLTVDLVRPSRSMRRRLFGERVKAICSSYLPYTHRISVRVVRRWPRGRERLRFHFARDISEDVVWCLLETPSGGDIAAGWYIRPEPFRPVGEGGSPSGVGWRMWGRMGSLTEPCLRVLFANDVRTNDCLGTAAGGFTRLATILDVRSCSGDTYVYGVAAPETVEVRLRLFDGTILTGQLLEPPADSQVNMRYFMAIAPGIAKVRAVRALASTGHVLGRKLYPRRIYWGRGCGFRLADP
jgi:hypothetical protein